MKLTRGENKILHPEEINAFTLFLILLLLMFSGIGHQHPPLDNGGNNPQPAQA